MTELKVRFKLNNKTFTHINELTRDERESLQHQLLIFEKKVRVHAAIHLLGQKLKHDASRLLSVVIE